ncbi:MAG: DegT/DnrJ/EryC1/StrS family aminotransferase [Thermoproteota archaeon]
MIKYPVAEPEIGEEELEYVSEAVKSGWVSSKGRFIEEFETGFSKYIGTKYGIAVSNGTAAIHLALTALEIGPGDEVIIPTLTFASVANAVIYTGAKPIFADSHPDYWNIDPYSIERKITKKTRAIIAVHSYGHPCDMDEIIHIARDYSLHLIEDCAEAHGAEYKGRKVGSFGVISCFSFYGNKIITTGEGGICLTNNEELANRIRILRDHGMNPNKKYWHDIIGFNYRMTNLQAALGVAQLKKIDSLVAKKRYIATVYRKLLQDLPDIKPAPEMGWAKSVYWLYSILVERNIRDTLIKSMEEKGIETRPFFYPIHKLPPYKCDQVLPVAEELSARGLSLPSGPKLSEDQIKEIVGVLKEILVKK